MSDPYRQAADMPKEEKEMSDKEMTLQIWKMALIAGVSVAALIMGHLIFSTIHTDNTALQKAQIESSAAAREIAQSKYLEAKALSDKAMFEQMAKQPAPPPAPAK